MRISITDWSEICSALALTFTRMPENGYLVLRAGDAGFVEFSMLRDGLRVEVSDVAAVDRRGATSGGCIWARQLKWPVRYVEYQQLASESVARMRANLKIVYPTELKFEAYVSSSAVEKFDVEALEYDPNPRVERW